MTVSIMLDWSGKIVFISNGVNFDRNRRISLISCSGAIKSSRTAEFVCIVADKIFWLKTRSLILLSKETLSAQPCVRGTIAMSASKKSAFGCRDDATVIEAVVAVGMTRVLKTTVTSGSKVKTNATKTKNAAMTAVTKASFFDPNKFISSLFTTF